MSLIITSNTNKILNSGYNQEGLNKSYSYQNHLNDTFKIPKNSEIAVQSVKINRSGNVEITEANSIYSFYFGEELGTDTAPNVNREVCSIPVEAGFSLTVTDDDMLGSVAWRGVGKYSGNVDNVARIMKQSLNRNLWHPMLMLNASTGKSWC